MRLKPQTDRMIRGMARRESVDNCETGYVTDVNAAGQITVQIDGYGEIVLPNASGQDVGIGDAVSIRTYGKNINTAEIAGKTSRRREDVNPLVVWR